MKITRFHRLASRELEEAIRYYDGETPGLGGRFLAEVEATVDLLHRFPEIGPRTGESSRRILVPGFPFDLLYKWIAQGRLRILSVAHHRREPTFWANRR